MTLKRARTLPDWLKVRLGQGADYRHVRHVLAANELHTVCRSARCPNLGECWSNGTATFLILGNVCTRRCAFCAVPKGVAGPPDPNEAERLVDAAASMNLSYIVITSVTRDDLPDGGASMFVRCVQRIRERLPGARVELLVPDFQGDVSAVKHVLQSNPDMLNHNVETVPRLYPAIRPQADFRRSIDLLERSARCLGEDRTKSGMMLGLGETRDEIIETLRKLRDAGVGCLTLGQYLQPTRNHIPPERFLSPETFRELGETALSMGFQHVASAPLVRSSYHAEKMAGSA